ncbi:MAG: rod shape-determining protein MreC [Saprospiraceae bacterium]|nr:rod shape-determining protein MreC [Saprospiraceae bacterium]
MRNLLLFFIKYNAFFLFIVLEIISFYMIVNNNEKQNQVYVSSANRMTGSFYERYDKIVGFWNLGDVNAELANDNKRLLEQLPNAYFDTEVDTIEVRDSFFEQQYRYIPAKIVNNSINRYDNYLTLNRGRSHGIKNNTGVITSNGIIGVVQKTSKNYTVVMSILHHNTRISAKIKNSDYFGSLLWKGGNPEYMYLDAIPKHATIEQGDTIITSGYSSKFPEGIMVGVVEDATVIKGSNFYDVKVKLSSDMSNLSHVFVVNNLMKKEKETLEKEVDAANE